MRIPLLLTIAGLLLAGCAAPDETGLSSSNVPEPGEVTATDSTGGLRGVVVDAAIRPIAGVTVGVTGNGAAKNVTTDAGGTFVVSGLREGTYVVKATHPFFQTVQQTADVKAGVKNPQAIKIQMEAKLSDRPYMTQSLFKGFITCSVGSSYVASEECGEGAGAPCVQDPVPCGRFGGQDDNNVQYNFYVDGPHVRSIIIEQAWTAASEATGNLYTVAPATNWTCDPFCSGNQIADMAGASPLMSRIEVVDGVALAHPPVILGSGSTVQNQTLTAETRLTTFTWPEWGACPPDPEVAVQTDPTCLAQLNIATNQEFRLFVSSFYFLPAPDEWSVVNGDENPFR